MALCIEPSLGVLVFFWSSRLFGYSLALVQWLSKLVIGLFERFTSFSLGFRLASFWAEITQLIDVFAVFLGFEGLLWYLGI